MSKMSTFDIVIRGTSNAQFYYDNCKLNCDKCKVKSICKISPELLKLRIVK
jgi:hypothetical protein